MKNITLILTCVLTLSTLVTRHAPAAPPPVLWATHSLTTLRHNSHPSLHGSYLVWQAKGGLPGTASSQKDWEIFYYNLEGKTVHQLTDDALDDTLPQTDGSSIVWQKFDTSTGNQIFLFQEDGGSPTGGTQISVSDTGEQFSPNIADGLIVWSRQNNEESYSAREIVLYNTKTHTSPSLISNPAHNCSAPRIAAKQIIYLQYNPDGTETLFLYDGNDTTPVAAPAPEGVIWLTNSQPADGQRVLSRYSGNDREIYLHTPTKGYRQISDNDLNDTNPIIHQNYIAWVADKDIYLTNINARMLAPQAEDKCSFFIIPTKNGTTISICL